MIIKTRKLPATTTAGERMRATADNGASLTLPFGYEWESPDEFVAMALAKALSHGELMAEFTLTRVSGNRWEYTS